MSEAKASSEGSTMRQGHLLGFFGPACLCVLGLFAFLGIGAPSALAATPPEVSTAPIYDFGQTSLTLRAFVNPGGAPLTDCHFDFGSTEAYGQTLPCEGETGQGEEPVLVTARFSGLQAASAYHYELIAKNGFGSVSSGDVEVETLQSSSNPSCPNVQFRQGTSARLPDCRAYEMVSPPEKNGGNVIPWTLRTRAASDGSAVQFSSSTGFGDVRGSGITHSYIARRDAQPGTNGWSTHAILPGNIEPTPNGAQGFIYGFDLQYLGELSPDLSRGAFLAINPLTSDLDVAAVPNLYLADNLLEPGERHLHLLTACPACATTGPLPPVFPSLQPFFAGASANFSHVIYETPLNLTDDAQSLDPERNKLYEWTAGGTVSLVGQVPASGTECGPAGPACVAAPGSIAGASNASNHAYDYTASTISTDGSRIYFTEPVSNAIAGRLYLRTDNGTPDATTVQVNVAEPTPNPQPLDDGRYWTATPDGSKVLFTTRENLLPVDTNDESRITDLYMWDAEAPAGERLTLISRPDPGRGGSVSTAIDISADGHYVYFAAEQLLNGQPPSSGVDKIFVWHDGTIHEVAQIDSIDRDDISGAVNWVSDPKTSRLSPDGTHLLFMSRRSRSGEISDELPHDASSDTCPGAAATEGCKEVYLYDAIAHGGGGSLACLSCTRPDSPAHSDATFIAEADINFAGRTSHLNHPLSVDGRYAFFNTAERLLPNDTNGVADVYEYDSLTGNLHLLSSGEGKQGAYFMDASLDGKDAILATRERLSGWDVDASWDLYDARADGGLPEPPPPPPSCQGDACQPPSLQLNDPTPASAAFSGSGNPSARHHKKRHRAKGRHHKRQRAATHRHG